MIVYSYFGYTITQDITSGRCYITYPNETESSVFTHSLDKAYEFIEEMIRGEIWYEKIWIK